VENISGVSEPNDNRLKQTDPLIQISIGLLGETAFLPSKLNKQMRNWIYGSVCYLRV